MANIILALAVFASAVSAAAVCAGDTYAVGTGSASASTGMTTCAYARTDPTTYTFSLTSLLMFCSFCACGSPIRETTAKLTCHEPPTDNIYTASTCAVYETVSVITSTPCDNPYFHCAAGTTRYDEFDDNESGTSYLLDTDSGESCGSDAILYCVSCDHTLSATYSCSSRMVCLGADGR